MAYTKNTWASGDVVTSAKLNNIENGIASGGVLVVNMDENGVLDKTYSDISSAAFAVVTFIDYGEGDYPPIHTIDPVQAYYHNTMFNPQGYYVNTAYYTFFSATETGQLVKSE